MTEVPWPDDPPHDAPLTGLFGAELSRRAGALAIGGLDSKAFSSLADRCNRFLADYQRAWSALAERSCDGDERPTLLSEPYPSPRYRRP